jgi:SAM-dependent methyltransferase
MKFRFYRELNSNRKAPKILTKYALKRNVNMREQLERLRDILTNPECPGSVLEFRGDHLYCTETHAVFPITESGCVDFVGSYEQVHSPISKGIMFRINEFYNQRLEQKISNSWFAVGGCADGKIKKTLHEWLQNFQGLVLDIGAGDCSNKRYLGPGAQYISLDKTDVTKLSPWRHADPDINGDALKLPFRDNSIDAIMNVFVLEHVTDPARAIREMARVLKPGGKLFLVGPGDILPSHGEPHIYYNMTRYAYAHVFSECGLQIIEEQYPSKAFLSAISIIYKAIVRNDVYNKNTVLKLIQAMILGISLPLSVFVNLICEACDRVIPFDRRGYSTYVALVTKKST